MLSDATKKDFQLLKNELIDKLRPIDSEFKVKQEFYSSKQQPHETVEEFSQRLYNYKREWPIKEYSTFDEDICKIFKKGVKQSIAIHLVLVDSKDYRQLVSKAKANGTHREFNNGDKNHRSSNNHRYCNEIAFKKHEMLQM